jgi:hypothetical protein
MTDTFIENAMLALSGAWNNDTVNVNCAPLSEALMTVATSLASLRNQVAVLEDNSSRLRHVTDGLQDELVQQRARSTELEMRLTLLTTDTHGFVQRPELNERLSSLKTEILVGQRGDFEKMYSTVDSHHTLTVETHALASRNKDLLEHYKVHNDDAVSHLRQAVTNNEENCRLRIAEHGTVLDNHGRHIRELNSKLDQARKEDLGAEDAKITALKHSASAELHRHSEDILGHLKEQADAIQELQLAHEQRVASIPTADEVHRLIKSMDASKASIDEAQYRLNETFAQCMALMGSTTTNLARSRVASGVGASHVNHSAADVSSSSNPYTFAALSGAGGGGNASGGALNAAKKAETSIAASRVLAALQPSIGASSLLGSIPMGVEVQLDSVKHDLRNLQESVIPTCVHEIASVRKDAGAIAAVIERAEHLVATLLECLSLGDGQELRASLLAHDHHKTVLLLRRAFTVLASHKYHPPSQFLASGSPDGKGISERRASRAFGVSTGTGQSKPAAAKRDGATTSVDMDDTLHHDMGTDDLVDLSAIPSAEPAAKLPSTAFVPPSVWDRRAVVERTDEPVVAEILRRYRAPPLGLDLADAIGGTLGANVMLVVQGSIAGQQGVGVGDRIIKVNGERCDNCESFVRLLQIATRRAVINHHAQGFAVDTAPVLQLDLTLIGKSANTTRHVVVHCPLARSESGALP